MGNGWIRIGAGWCSELARVFGIDDCRSRCGTLLLMSPKNTNGAGLIPAPLFKLYIYYITLPGVKVT
jgi:hypothetical protein